MTLSITDLFCGAGGSSIGAEQAGATLKLGLNHWARAIETHATNFPHADHDCEDVSSLTTSQIRRYPDSDILLASPECTNHSLAKGSRRRKPQAASLLDEGPPGDAEQDRSRATMWDVVRFAEQKRLKGKPYKAIIVENVVDAFKWGHNDDGGLFAAWRQAMTALGYSSEIVYLNSMFAPPTPQSRDRMYVVYWLKGIRRPNLNVHPPSWCPSCETVVDGVQTWKKPTAPWGRYGAQYVYGCTLCQTVVHPGAFPAASAIDWDLVAPRIGDRVRPLAPNTMERIRRGLERLAREPFAIRLLQGGQPRPLTLPLVTLTQRHDVAMVIPVAGNTFERTPGNRARDAGVRPMDTVHGGAQRVKEPVPFALVCPAGGTWRRDATDAADPHPTQTASEASALVLPYSEVAAARDALTAPAPTQRTNPTLAMVYTNRNNGVGKRAEESPAQAVCTGGHLGVVVRNNTPRGDAGQMATPAHEPFRTLTASCTQSLVVPYGSRALDPNSEPQKTLTTRDRLALVVPPMGDVTPRSAQFEPASTQTTTTRAALVEISDEAIDECGFRMFELDEIARTMAMADHPHDGLYEVLGNKRERMAQYGNAVTPPVMRLLVERIAEVLA